MDHMEEHNCKYVSSFGIAKSCDIHSMMLCSSICSIDDRVLNSTFEGATVYVCSTAINNFTMNFLPKLKHNIILVTGNSDDTISYENPDCKTIIESSKIIHWFSQNSIMKHVKMTQIPIGMDYHTLYKYQMSWGNRQYPLDQDQDIQDIIMYKKHFSDRKPMCYATFHFQLQRGDRMEAYNSIPKELVYYENNNVLRLVTHKTQLEYAFVISPFGLGLDCYRTWEALIMGCIPIIAHSELDSLYDELPVLFVNKWSDVTQQLLDSTINDFKGKQFNYNKLDLKYWVDKIKYKSNIL